MNVLLVGLGGGAGAIARYLLSGAAQGVARGSAFFVGTLLVNVLGCFAIGVVSELAERRGYITSEARALVVVGFLGGFTTFSAFANETVNAVRGGTPWLGVLNVVVSLVTCLAAVWLGRGALALLVK